MGMKLIPTTTNAVNIIINVVEVYHEIKETDASITQLSLSNTIDGASTRITQVLVSF